MTTTINEDNSSVSSGSSLEDYETGTSTSSHNEGHEEKKVELSKKETEAVFRLRVLVFLILFLASITVSLIVYFITTRAMEDEYDSGYAAAAEKVAEAFMDIAESKIGVLASLGVAMTAHGIDHSRKWPFVTLSSYQQRASAARSHSGALDVVLCPLVNETQRTEWDYFVNKTKMAWIEESVLYQEATGTLDFLKSSNSPFLVVPTTPPPYSIWYYNEDNVKVIDPGHGPYLPRWQTSPLLSKGGRVNQNFARRNMTGSPLQAIASAQIVISELVMAPPGHVDSDNRDTAYFALLGSTARKKVVEYQGQPMSLISIPVFNDFDDDRQPAAVMASWVDWTLYFESVLPETVQGIHVVLSDSCGGFFTLAISGKSVKFLGSGDLHNHAFNHLRLATKFKRDQYIADGTNLGLSLNQEICNIGIDVYPSQAFYDSYKSSTPIILTVSVAIIFVFTAFMFVVYDRLVEHRQALVLQKAIQSTAIVSSLFPENVRERLMNEAVSTTKASENNSSLDVPLNRKKSYLGNGREQGDNNEPIADLFPFCTVLFADVAGFTAWSSTREPAQVFVLLQTLYQAFDEICKRRKVFKVETIGDSYVAVTGLPDPQPNHAVIMARFARDCMVKMKELMSDLESSLGPDTADLTMRIGMHSGPVTAGVLKGERARFQLFGDTVNTAARMESTGIKEKIQISKETQELLVQAGKEHWTRLRPDAVLAKGKGTLQTYWLNVYFKKAASSAGSSTSAGEYVANHTSTVPAEQSLEVEKFAASMKMTLNVEKQDRLIDWVVDLMTEQIVKLLAQRGDQQESMYEPKLERKEGIISLDEVADVIRLPSLRTCHIYRDIRRNDLIAEVQAQLRAYVAIIASTYHPNPFHNFEHACHVTMAVSKFIKRINATTTEDAQNNKKCSTRYDYTYGIYSDPLTVLAILFSALVHDADHRGVSNVQLGVEEPEMATIYKNKSIAEQNSLDIAWDLLMNDQFLALRRLLFTSETELQRFRQVVVNVVLATDIFEKDINEIRKKRWNRAFSETSSYDDADINDLRATIVIEHVIQASDVAHTMQHWHVYRKWNRLLFFEMHAAFKAGRMGKDPSDFWYQGELGFFDNYIIPLAKKLKDCNVFGVSSDECLNYATKNRAEWEVHGPELIAEMVEDLQSGKQETCNMITRVCL